MRVPKYRAWDKENKEMLFVRQIDFMFEKVVLGCYEQFFIDEVELMQSTGLKDINGKEVFEGDIIKDSEGFVAQVVYDKEYAGFGLNYQPFDLTDGLSVTFEELKNEYRNAFEVIGNIFENKDLLGE